MNVELDLGQRGLKARDGGRHDGLDDRGQPRQPDQPARAGRELLQMALRLLNLAQDHLGAAQEEAARVGQLKLVQAAVEQLGADFLFELGELLRERGLREAEPLGRLGEGGRLGDGAENPQLVQIHGRDTLDEGVRARRWTVRRSGCRPGTALLCTALRVKKPFASPTHRSWLTRGW